MECTKQFVGPAVPTVPASLIRTSISCQYVRPPKHRGSSLLKGKVRIRGARRAAGNSFARARIFCGGRASRELTRLCLWTARTTGRPGGEGVSPDEAVAQSPARSLCIYGPGRVGCSGKRRRSSSPQGAPPPQEVSCPPLPVRQKTRPRPGLFASARDNAWKTGRAIAACPADADRID